MDGIKKALHLRTLHHFHTLFQKAPLETMPKNGQIRVLYLLFGNEISRNSIEIYSSLLIL